MIVLSCSCLNARLLIGREQIFPGPQALSLPLTVVQIKRSACSDFEVRVPRENPGAMVPGTNRIFIQPAPDRGTADLCDEASSDGLGSNL